MSEKPLSGVDYLRLRGALHDKGARTSAIKAVDVSWKTLDRWLTAKRLTEDQYEKIVEALNGDFEDFLTPEANGELLQRKRLLGRWETVHIEFDVKKSGELYLHEEQGWLDVSESGKDLTVDTHLIPNKDRKQSELKERVLQAWHRGPVLSFESEIEGWTYPSGLSLTMMHLSGSGVMYGYTTFYDEIIEKPFCSPHLAYRKKIEGTAIESRARVWFNSQKQSLEALAVVNRR